MALEDELSDQANHNSKLLQGVCLLDHAYRREHRTGSANLPILEGFSMPRTAVAPFRTSETVSLAPQPIPCGEGTDNQDMFVDYVRIEDKYP
jgi:hypothetical protein